MIELSAQVQRGLKCYVGLARSVDAAHNEVSPLGGNLMSYIHTRLLKFIFPFRMLLVPV